MVDTITTNFGSQGLGSASWRVSRGATRAKVETALAGAPLTHGVVHVLSDSVSWTMEVSFHYAVFFFFLLPSLQYGEVLNVETVSAGVRFSRGGLKPKLKESKQLLKLLLCSGIHAIGGLFSTVHLLWDTLVETHISIFRSRSKGYPNERGGNPTPTGSRFEGVFS